MYVCVYVILLWPWECIRGAAERKGPGMWGVAFWPKTLREYSNFGLFNGTLGLLGTLKCSIEYEARHWAFLHKRKSELERRITWADAFYQPAPCWARSLIYGSPGPPVLLLSMGQIKESCTNSLWQWLPRQQVGEWKGRELNQSLVNLRVGHILFCWIISLPE